LARHECLAAPDGERPFGNFEGAALQGSQQPVPSASKDVARLLQLHGEAGVELRPRRSCPDAGAWPWGPISALGEIGQEGDDVVLGLALDINRYRGHFLCGAFSATRLGVAVLWCEKQTTTSPSG
jgi:hypothetical protein